MDEYIQLPLTAAALRKWLRFSERGGIGQAVGLLDKLAESGTDELMFMEGEAITVLMQLDNDRYLGSCEGVVGIFHETDVRFTTSLKKPVFTKKPTKLGLQVSTSSALQQSLPISQAGSVTDSPATPHALSPAQTPSTQSQSVERRTFSAPTPASALLAFQFPASDLASHQPAHDIYSGLYATSIQESTSRLDKTDHKANKPSSATELPNLQHSPSQIPEETLRAASGLDDNDDILSSYVYNTSLEECDSSPRRRDEEKRGDMEHSTSALPWATSISERCDGNTGIYTSSNLLAPLKIRKIVNDPSDVESLQERPKHSQRTEVPSKVMILPNLPAGVSLKQLRERSSPRFPLSPRSTSASGPATRYNPVPPILARQQSDLQHPSQHSKSGDIAQYVDTNNISWTEQAQTPIVSPVPSSFVSTDSPRYGFSPISPTHPETETLVMSSSSTSMSKAMLPSHRATGNIRDSPGWPDLYGSTRDGGSETRSLISIGSSSRGLTHSRSLSSLTRAGSSMFQRRPSLPTRSESASESLREDGTVELCNAQFEFVQPQGTDSDAGSPHSTLDSLQVGFSSRLVTRPSPSAKERVRSIYIPADTRDPAETQVVVDKYGFIHNEQSVFSGPDLDIPDAKDAMGLQAYRARELKWVTIMSTMSARSARSSGKVKKLINYGIPNSVRGRAWTYLAEAFARKKETLFHDLCARGEIPDCEHIISDIDVCFHDHSHYADEDALGRQDLHSVLHALLHYLPDVSYEQGLCYLAGMLLLHVEAESAFWLLVACVLDYLPTYFVQNRQGSFLDANILLYILQRGEPELIAQLHEQGVTPSLLFRGWLSSAFVRTLPWASQLRVMDLFFFGERPSQLGIRVGLAVVDLLRETLLAKRQNVTKVLQSPPIELLKLSAFLPTLLTIKLPNRTLKKATKWAHAQIPSM